MIMNKVLHDYEIACDRLAYAEKILNEIRNTVWVRESDGRIYFDDVKQNDKILTLMEMYDRRWRPELKSL